MLEVDHTRVHGVVGKHLLSLQVRGGCGQEEIERWPVYYNYKNIVQLVDGEHVVQVPEQDKDWGAAHSTQHP